MSNYDLVAISSKPDFFLSSNAVGDQSGKTLYPVANSASNTGQPIIVGNPSSYLIDDAHTIAIDNNPILFRPGNDFEFVVFLPEPQDSMLIFGDASGENGIYVSASSIEFRFTDGAEVVNRITIPVDTWLAKFYILLSFDHQAATFQVNQVQQSAPCTPRDPSLVGQVKFSAPVGYQYSVDGIGVYADAFTKKDSFLNALTFGYPMHISKWYGATSTDLISQHIAETYVVNKRDFSLTGINSTSAFMQMLPVGLEYGFIGIESNSQLPIAYQVNEEAEQAFTKYAVVTAAQAAQYIRFKSDDTAEDFTITIRIHEAGIVDMLGPAQFSLSAGAFYPSSFDIAMVNCPRGVRLSGGYMSGTWIDEPPQSIEIVFRPLDKTTTHVFSSATGNATYGASGSINGYTAWLNGKPVTNLNDIVVNQWNHLVLTSADISATDFKLNATALGNSAGNIEYLFLAAYPAQVQLVPELYSMVSSSYSFSHREVPTSQIHEGEGDPGSPFSTYSFAWAIVGGGGK